MNLWRQRCSVRLFDSTVESVRTILEKKAVVINVAKSYGLKR